MKGFAFVLLCALVAVQGRYTSVQQSPRTEAALGENPWVVHLRIAVSYSGLLETCVGTLIDNRWVLTTANCLQDARFIWVRYGAVNVISPELVTENSAVTLHPEYNAATGENNIGLISINRDVHSTDNISPASLPSDSETPESATYCGYGEESGVPGEVLSCVDATVETNDDGTLSVTGVDAVKNDVGAPLVSDGVQYALLTAADGTFTAVADYVSWIESVTGVTFTAEVVPEVAPEAVRFVN